MTEKMKHSGIAWIGNIPDSWDIKRIKYLASLKGRIGWQGLTADEYTDEGPYLITGIDFINGRVDWENCVHITEERWKEAPEIHIKNGDLLITKDGTVGKVAIVDKLEDKASLNSGVLLVRTIDGFNKKFLFWALQSEEFWTWFRLKNAGNSTIIHLYQGDFAEFSYTFPKETEQQLIADFLDERCAEINSVIADLEKQIEILEKYKKSLIAETVTKGLDKTVELKPSELGWTDSIPKSWCVKKISYMANSRSGGTPDRNNLDYWENGDIPWMSSGEVNKRNVYETEEKITILATRNSSAKIIPANSVLIALNGQGKTKGMSAILRIDSACNQSLCAFSCYEGVLHYEYLFWCFQAMYSYLRSMAGDGVRDGLAASYVQKQKIPVPVFSEQVEIANYLNKKCEQIDGIVEEKQHQLKAIQQHKKSLIYEYVTGKKRVKEAL